MKEVRPTQLQQYTADKVNIVAVMVEFQQDDNRFTSGNGSFNLPYLDRDDIIIDPLPHDRFYFEAHLEFVKNYYERVSNGKLDVDYMVLPDVYQLDEEMAAYSPLGEDGDENYKLAHLTQETWAKVAAQGDFDASAYDQEQTMFVIFHAGAGRDLELLGTSLNKTPQDIPSVYLGHNTLERLLDEPGFQGFQIDNSNFRITNTAILPQTETRPGEDVTGEEYVLELSINGMLTATVGSFLGLPDLFNTETGDAGIGRFGLMDGASIFSYLGMFPPEPSAWEKVHMGWQEPIDIELDPVKKIELPAAVLNQENSIARHRISKDEYFLIENRHRDPNHEGVTITIKKPGGERESVTISNSDTRFDPFDSAEYDELLPKGVVVDVSNFDWSLPGGLDIGEDEEEGTEDDKTLSGGILIWHIDDAVIKKKINDNAINNDPDRKGVSLVEADGARDIGRETEGLDGTRFNQGHAYDFWWSGNDFTVITGNREQFIVYENRFGKDTNPSNHSNTDSPSFFEFDDFSDNMPIASFKARKDSTDWFYEKAFTGELLGAVQTYNTEQYASGWPLGLSLFESGTDSILIIPSPETVYGLGINEDAPDPIDFDHPRPHQPLLAADRLILTQNSGIPGTNVPTKAWNIANSVWEEDWINEEITESAGLLSSMSGDTLEYDRTRDRVLQINGNQTTGLPDSRQRSESVNGLYSTLYGNRVELSDGTIHNLNTEQQNSTRLYTGFIRLGSGPAFFLLSDRGLDIIEPGQESYSWIHDTDLGWPAVLDLSQNGEPDVIYVDKGRNQLTGRNLSGAILDNFPLSPPSGSRFTGTPILSDITGNGELDLLITVQDSLSVTIHGYDSS
ncbi:MAG: hypothetical protein WED82_05260, partial [Balneolales bacterium]